MGNYLNPGSTLFRYSLRSEIYVDKSGLIEKTNKLTYCATSNKLYENL